MGDVFLSAGVPRHGIPKMFPQADVLLIRSAVRSLCTLLFGLKRIVWGGHPAITPMMWAACENLGIAYAETVHLYQSRFFEELYPEENARFGNVTYVDRRADRRSSLLAMRRAMFTDAPFEAAIFIGGEFGVLEEFTLFRQLQPDAQSIILPSTGGAAGYLGKRYPQCSAPSGHFVDFIGYLAKRLNLESDSRSRSYEPGKFT